MAQNDLFLAQYFNSGTVRERNKAGLVNWSGYISAIAIPTDPTDDWIRIRIAAEQIPISLEASVQGTLGYFIQDPAIKQNINKLLSASNNEADETSLSTVNEGVINGFMPRYVAAYVTDAQVTAWRKQNGYEVPPEEPPAMQHLPGQNPTLLN